VPRLGTLPSPSVVGSSQHQTEHPGLSEVPNPIMVGFD